MDNPMDVFQNRNITAPTRRELIWGALAWLLYLGGISLIMSLLGFRTDTDQSAYAFQFAHQLFSFITVLIVFRKLLFRSHCDLFRLVTTALLGYLALNGISYFWSVLVSFVPVELNNLNQASVEASIQYEPMSMAFHAIIMAPFVEELLVRGTIFAPLCKRSPLLAYAVSMAVFAFLHILGSIGAQPPLQLLRSFLEYLPAGFIMAWAYQRTGSIYGPIALHAFSNALSVFFILRG